MKVLLVSRLYPPHPGRGSAFTTQRLAEELSRLGVEVVVINSPDVVETTTRWHNGVMVYDIPIPNFRKLTQVRERKDPQSQAVFKRMLTRRNEVIGNIVQIINKEAPNVVHTMTTSFPPGPLWRKVKEMGFPIVHTLQLHTLLCRNELMFKEGRRCETPCDDECKKIVETGREVTRHVDAVVGCSQFITDLHLEQGLFHEATVKTAIFNSTPTNPLPKRQRPPQQRLQIGFLGQISTDKGIGWLLRQLKRLPTANYDLWIAGRGSRQNQTAIERQIKNLPAKFIGYQPADKFLTHIDLLVIPSLWDEPFGLIAAEALAAGTPILTARRGGLVEIAESSNGVAELFEPQTPRTFLTKINRLIKNPTPLRNPSLHEKCREAAKRFSVQRMAEEYLSVYEKFI